MSLLLITLAVTFVNLVNAACVADKCRGVVYEYPKIIFKAGDKSIQCDTAFFYSFFYECPRSFQEGISCEIKKNPISSSVQCESLLHEDTITFGKQKIYSSSSFSIRSATLECKTDDKGGIFLEKCVLGVTIDFLGNPWMILFFDIVFVFSIVIAYSYRKDFQSLKFQELRHNIQFKQQLDEMNSKFTKKLYIIILLEAISAILGFFYIFTGHIALIIFMVYVGALPVFSVSTFYTDYLTKAKFIRDNQTQKVDIIVQK